MVYIYVYNAIHILHIRWMRLPIGGGHVTLIPRSIPDIPSFREIHPTFSADF